MPRLAKEETHMPGHHLGMGAAVVPMHDACVRSQQKAVSTQSLLERAPKREQLR